MIYLINTRAGALFLIFWGLVVGRLEATVTASSLAIVGYDDSRDSFSFMALDTLSAGEVIYFTNNGWSSSQGQFNGADPSQGAGNESIIKLTLNQSVTTGSVISTAVTNNSAWTWTNSGLVPGQAADGFGMFSNLALQYESDQIYAFQGLSDNPLLNPTNFIYALHMGSADYPGFSDSEDELTGAIPPGLSEAAKTAFAQTNLSMHGDADGNHSAWALNMSSPDIQQLQALGGSKSDWLNAIANSNNWGPVITTLDSAPEPAKTLFLLVGAIALTSKRRRHLV